MIPPADIWILDRFAPCWEDSTLTRALRSAGADAGYLDFTDLRVDDSGVRLGGRPVPSPHVVYVRSRVLTQHTEGDLALVYDWLDMLAGTGARMINTMSAVRLCQNKILQAHRLARAGVPVPATRLVGTTTEIEQCLTEWGELVLKPVYGHASIDVVRLRPPRPGAGGSGLASAEEVRAWHALRTHRVLCAQRYVPNSGRDLRVAFIGDRVVSCYWRRVEMRALDYRYDLEACPPTDEVRKIVAAAAGALDVEIGTMDLVEGPNGVTVIEVNSSLSVWERIEKVPGLDLTDRGITQCHADLLLTALGERSSVRKDA